MHLERGDPRRPALLTALVIGAAVWADAALARRVDFGVRSRLTRIALTVGPVIGVVAAGVLVPGRCAGELRDVRGRACAGLIAAAGVLYPIE